MEKTSLQGRGPTADLGQLDDNAIDRLIVDSYSRPHKFVLKYIMTPFANHPIRLILVILVFVYGPLITCNIWNDDVEVCDRRFHYMHYSIILGFLALTIYSNFLKWKLDSEKKRLLSQDAEIGSNVQGPKH
ncbi:uncharacterized protein TRUGW13939_06594 [Talaromyces rugulosus]|uniref:Uncharacterized protein n=1 Tax=Talaromyces rugulosus TaxID=121627 RepID=A0A7H8QZD9_TALRU|nr:uncharacterized protein TRUGW13939_06594 [Talaromyces rugulosus]QKX59460.1 hypothetical protein TRUGW13939_06594 [Talaromyces rugulosus]